MLLSWNRRKGLGVLEITQGPVNFIGSVALALKRHPKKPAIWGGSKLTEKLRVPAKHFTELPRERVDAHHKREIELALPKARGNELASTPEVGN